MEYMKSADDLNALPRLESLGIN